MNLIEVLRINKGTVSSALGKELAQRVLNGEDDLLYQALKLCTFDYKNPLEKNIRAGAAKIVEIVAKKRPEFVSPFLEILFPALEVKEPQTKWMIIRTMGFCAEKNEIVAKKAVVFAKEYINNKEGLCLASSSDLFLGDIGSLSKDNAKQVFPILEKSINNVIKNEQDWILEACYKLFNNLGISEKEIVISFARINANSDKKATQKRACKILKFYEDQN